MALDGFTKTILAVQVPHETPIEHRFWKELGDCSARQGWQLIMINARGLPTPPMKGVLSLDMVTSNPDRIANVMKDLPREGLELTLPWLSKEDLNLLEEFLMRRSGREGNEAMTQGLIRLAHFAETTIRTLRPAIVVTWNAVPSISALFRKAGLYHGSYTVLLERSPFDSVWLEPKGLFAESRIWQYSRERWSNGPAKMRELGAAICDRLASNPNTAFRAIGRTEWSRNHELRRPVFFLPIDHVVFNYWGQSNHPQGKIDYPLFDDPHQAIAELAGVAVSFGGSLAVKSHPGCRQVTREKMPEGVAFVEPMADLADAIDAADIIVAFNTKVAFPALAMNKPVVTLAPNPIAVSGATYHCTEIGGLHGVIEHALNNTDFEHKSHLFRSFCGFLASEVFYGATSRDELHPRGPADLVDDLVAHTGPIVPDSRGKTYRGLTNIAMLASGDSRASYRAPAEEADTKALPGRFRLRGRMAPIAPPGWTKELSTMDHLMLYLKKLDRRTLNYLARHFPSLIYLGRFGMWGLGVLKKTSFGIGGIALLVVAGLFVAGALVGGPLRWYLIGVAGALLLLCGGVLALSYARSVLSQSFAEQRRQVSQINDRVSQINRQVSGVNKQVSGLSKQVSDINREVSDNKNTLANTNVGNFPAFQQFNRRLTNQDLKRFSAEWGPRLGLDLNGRALAYIAHRICLAEDTCLGRLAGNIETMVLRVLIARGVKEPDLAVLEIGTLFGVGVAIIHESCMRFFEDVHVTVIDPLDGFYDKAQLDPATSMPVTREIFVHNMQRMSIPESDYTIIQKLSTEDEALREASKKSYNLLIIDGDHSYSGVRHDFDNYRHLVKHGGYVIFDDYGNPRWPDIKAFVDKEVVGLPQLEFVGTDIHSAVFRVIAPPDSTQQEPH